MEISYKVALHNLKKVWVTSGFVVIKRYAILLSGKSDWWTTEVSTNYLGVTENS